MSRRWPRSVRARLALSFGLALLAIVSIYAAAVSVQVRDDFYEELDRQLASDFALALEWMGRPALASTLSEPPELAPTARTERDRDLPWLEIWSTEGQLLMSTGRRPSLPSPPSASRGRHRGPATVHLSDGRPVRVLCGTATAGDRSVVVRVGRSEGFTRHELWELVTALLLSLPIAFAAAAGAGYWLAARALAPVEAMTARARQITADRLKDRLPVENAADELGQLATVINGALARLDQSFDTLRRFTADAAHELRTPLTTIRSVGEVGLRAHRSETEYREIVGSLLEEAGRLTAMIDNLLTLSQADAGRVQLQPTVFPLTELATDATDVLGVLAEEKGQQLVVEGDSGVLVRGDRTTLRQAVMNLADNAIKYSPERTTVRLQVARRGASASLEVVDAGPGIPPEHLPHIFDRFYRIDPGRSREAGGTGLGLSIAAWAVEANGGRIEVVPAMPHGCVFRVVLPAVHQEPEVNP